MAAYFSSLGFTSPSLQSQLHASLSQSGLSSLSSISTFPVSGLHALVASLAVCASSAAVPTSTLTVSVPHDKTRFTVSSVPVGSSLYDVVKTASLPGADLLADYLPVSCGGNMSCSTCHVHVCDEKAYRDLLPEGTAGGGGREVPEAEMDMLDLAKDYKEGKSRLGCQIKMPIDGLTISLPNGVNDFWN